MLIHSSVQDVVLTPHQGTCMRARQSRLRSRPLIGTLDAVSWAASTLASTAMTDPTLDLVLKQWCADWDETFGGKRLRALRALALDAFLHPERFTVHEMALVRERLLREECRDCP